MEHDRAEESRELRRDVYRELAAWLRRQRESPKGPGFWNRPITITLVGSVLLTMITTGWQIYEKRSQISLEYERSLIRERTSLLKEVSVTYAGAAQIVNGWFTRVVWIAEETNKRQTPQTIRNLNDWKKQVREAEAAYQKAEPLEGILARIAVIYACPSVRSDATAMASNWRSFVRDFQAFNRKWNDLQKLAPAQITSAETSRKESLERLEASVRTLVEKMSGELVHAQGQANKCPA